MLVRRVWPFRPAFENPFGDVDQLRREVMRLLGSQAEGGPFPEGGTGVFPPINVTQDQDSFHLRAEVPGIKANELSISAVKNRVSIAGKREIPREQERVSYHRRERAEGSFDRTVTLPSDLDAERVEARYTDGILTVTLPKAAETKPRQIVVKA